MSNLRPWLSLLELSFLLPVCSLGPGLLVSRYLKWEAKETFCATIAFSFLCIYVAGFVIAEASLPRVSYVLFSFFCAGALVWRFRDLRKLLSDHTVRLFLAGFGVCFIWTLLHNSLIRSLSGGIWSGDWEEHYNRALFFMELLPRGVLGIAGAAVPARPPLMNVVTSYFMGQVGRSFEIYQLTSLYLNTLVIFPIMLVLSAVSRHFRRLLPLLLWLVLLNPMALRNLTYPWTRMFTSFYLLLAISLYFVGRKKSDQHYMAVAFLFVTASVLSHYSAVPFAIFLGLHYLVSVYPGRGRGRIKEFIGIAVPSLALALTWFASSIVHYGLSATFASNTTATGGMHPAHIAQNFFSTLVPHPFRLAPGVIDAWTATQGSLAYLREYFFLMYQTNIWVAIGTVGGVVAVWQAAKAWKSAHPEARPEVRLWVALFTFCFVLGVIVIPGQDPYGVAHICGQPLVLLTLIFLATQLLDLSRFTKIAITLGLGVDYVLGIFVQFRLENRVFPQDPAGIFSHLLSSTDKVSFHANLNWVQKMRGNYVFFGDHFGAIAPLISAGLLVLAGFGSFWALRLMLRTKQPTLSAPGCP